jgi:hypothetical protein
MGVVPSIFLEMLLVRISGRGFGLFHVFLSALFVIAGVIWINADRKLESSGYPRLTFHVSAWGESAEWRQIR